MAVVQYGSIVTSLKGTVGGQVFQAGNKSQVLRNKGYRKGTSSLLRQAANSIISLNAIAWRTLTDVQKASFASVAASWPFKDKFGNTYFGSAYQVFVAYNSGLNQIGIDSVTTAGTPLSAEAVLDRSIDADSSSVMDVSWTSNLVVPQTMQIFMSAPVSRGLNGNNIKMKLVAITDTVSVNTLGISAAYDNLYGGRQVNSAIWYRTVIRVNTFPLAVLSETAQLIVS